MPGWHNGTAAVSNLIQVNCFPKGCLGSIPSPGVKMIKKDPRIKKLAKLIVNHSLNIKKGEKIFVDSSDIAKKFIEELSKQIILKKAAPVLNVYPADYKKNLLKSLSEKQLGFFPQYLLNKAKTTQGIVDIENEAFNLSNIPERKIKTYSSSMKPYWDFLIYHRGNYRRATVLLPLKKEAKDAKMPLKQFQDYVYSCCFVNWKKLAKKFRKINRIFEQGKEVYLIGENINLKFSIKGRNSILEAGKENLPGGEIYMAPIKDSLEGWVRFEYPSIRDGLEISGIFLKFKKGKVIDFSAEKNEKFLRSLLNTDQGARYIGEFGIGINPKANKITNSWIDEKISGTIHIALGKSYEENNGDNDSAIHWDLVKDMRNAKIILDNKIIQKNGKWLV